MIFFYFAENSTNHFIVCGYCVFLNNSCVLSTESLIDNERLIKKKFKYNLLLFLITRRDITYKPFLFAIIYLSSSEILFVYKLSVDLIEFLKKRFSNIIIIRID